MRWELRPGLLVLRRGPATVQIGLDARHGVIVDGLSPAGLAALTSGGAGAFRPGPRRLATLLAGTGVLRRARDPVGTTREPDVPSRLAPDATAWGLVHRDAGDGRDVLAVRRRLTVDVHGSGRTALTLIAVLSAAGVGAVRLEGGGPVTAADLAPGGARPRDVGRPVARVAAELVARARADPDDDLAPAPPPGAGSPGTGPGRTDPRDPGSDRTGPHGTGSRGPADLVVLVGRGAADSARGARLLAADVPHLSVVIKETSIVVGPLVVPGRGACLRCLDLHRTARDPQWPIVLARLLSSGAAASPALREETCLAQIAAGVAALQVLGHLDGRADAAALGATLEVELPDGLVSRRSWPSHPACGCSWPLPTRTIRSTRPTQDGRGGRGTGTMTVWPTFPAER